MVVLVGSPGGEGEESQSLNWDRYIHYLGDVASHLGGALFLHKFVILTSAAHVKAYKIAQLSKRSQPCSAV